jgi:hypothetical protein
LQHVLHAREREQLVNRSHSYFVLLNTSNSPSPISDKHHSSSLVACCVRSLCITPNRQSLSMMFEDNNLRRREPKRRRATIDNSSLGNSAGLARPAQHVAKKRLSLPPRKTVHFSSMSDLVLFEEHSPFNVTWYTTKDQQQFKRDQKRDITIFRELQRKRTATSAPVPPPDSCPVGIEQHIFTPNLAQTYLSRRIVIRSVVLEQKRQKAFGYCNPGHIAALAEGLTAESCADALMRGKYQEELAKVSVCDEHDAIVDSRCDI